MIRRCLLACCLLPVLSHAQDDGLQLAWQTANGQQLVRLNQNSAQSKETLPTALQTPLGSLWKLFVYAWLTDTKQHEPAYQCRGQDKEEVYCCNPGQSIARGPALARSCGLYFEPRRLGVSNETWHTYWNARQAPDWLRDLDRLKPETRVPVSELLDTLARLPAQEQARRDLLEVLLRTADGQVIGSLGSRLRVKTWTWQDDEDPQARQGGFAGWLSDGTPLWARGRGTSVRVLKDHAVALDGFLPVTQPVDQGPCVEVALFARYPLSRVKDARGRPARPGLLQGAHHVEFANGNSLGIYSDSDLYLVQGGEQLHLIARLPREEYVARVLDREADSVPVEAARALAITIRTYLLQNAARQGECLSIDDSSQRQRVAPRPASTGARRIAAWTDDLVISDGPVTYHAELASDGKLSWQNAVAQANAGMRYDTILLRAFPRNDLSQWYNPQASCQPITAAEQWLNNQRSRWRQRLNQEPGYQETADFIVCKLSSGRPYLDREQQRIFARGVYSLQERLDLTHEYLHLAFQAHPNGHNEDYIEQLARHLLLE